MGSKNESLATLAANIKQGIDSRLKDLHTSMPAIIESFDAATQIATVQPAIKRIFKTNEGDTELLTPSELPILINVPVQFPRGGGFSLTFPVAKGDECLLVFAERSIDNWHKNGGVQNPGAKRFHSLSDATAFVGISSLVNKVPNYDPTNVQLKKDDHSVFITMKANADLDTHTDGNTNIDADVDVNITADGDVNVTAIGDINGTCVNANITASTKATVTAPETEITGNVTIGGDLSVGGKASITGKVDADDFTTTNVQANTLSTHVHPGPTLPPTIGT